MRARRYLPYLAPAAPRSARASAVTALGGADDRTSRSYPPPTGSGRLRITAGALPSAGFSSGLFCRRAPRVRGLRLARGQLAYVRMRRGAQD